MSLDFRRFGGHDDFIRQGESFPIRVATADILGKPVLGLFPNITIENLATNLYWSGGDFNASIPQLLAMQPLSGNVHLDGLYQYVLNLPEKGLFRGILIEWSATLGAYLLAKGRL